MTFSVSRFYIALVVAGMVTTTVGRADEAARIAAGKALLEELRARAEAPTAAVATATCALSAPKTRPRQAHGTGALDYEQEMTLRNAHIVYTLRYWITAATATGTSPDAPEGSTGLGMNRPTAANWYANNFLELTYGGRPILKNALAEFTTATAAGPVAQGRIHWTTPQADVTLLIDLPAAGIALDLRCLVTAKGTAPQPVKLGFRAYPGHYPLPRARRAATALREYAAPAQLVLGAAEPAVFLFDQHDADTGCGLRTPDPRPQEVALDLGEYGVTLNLTYPAVPVLETGPIRLWEFARTPFNTAMTAVLDDDHASRR